MGKRPIRQLQHGRSMMVALLLLAFALRVYNLGKLEFWFDEVLSANISGLGLEGAVSYLRNEPFEHPPLYFLLLYPWQVLTGTSEFAFRFFSVFWGVLLVPLLYILVKWLTDERLGWLVALLATISPFMVAYSQEARMYTLLPCLALLVLLTFYRALERKGQPGWWLAYALLLAVGVATHYFFVLVWAATTVYLLLEWSRPRKMRLWGSIVQLLILVAGVVWLIAAPGLRSSLLRLSQGEAAFSLAYKLNRIMPTLMLSEIGGTKVPLVAHVLAAGGWVLAVVGVWWSRRAQVLDSGAWRLLVLLLVIPLLGSFLIPYGVLGRHLGYTLLAVFTFMALGLMALRRRGLFWLGVGILGVLISSTYGLVVQYSKTNGDFAEALAYIDAHGQEGDLLIMTQPAQSHLVEYYNEKSWPVRYLPEAGTPLTQQDVEDTLRRIGQTRSRVWLGPIGAWTADPELLVERWLAANAFQATKAWFPDSSSVALYFTSDEEVARVDADQLTWGGQVRLDRLQTSSLQVLPGEAVRLRFHWRAGFALDQRYEVSLLLVDEHGVVWAERHSEPCGGWCPTDGWAAGQLQSDQHALLIPPGTPPGTFHLQVAWGPLDGGPALQVEKGQEHMQQATVAEVTVVRAPVAIGDLGTLPNPVQARFGGEIALLGYELLRDEARPGETLHLETHWRAESEPTGDYDLLVELTDRGGRVAASWQVTPSANSYPTSAWSPGEYLRGQHYLLLPQSLSPGRYRMQLALVSSDGERLELAGERRQPALAGVFTLMDHLEGHELTVSTVRVFDRPRQFELPPVGHDLEATVGRHAHLVGYDLDLEEAHPGGHLRLTLYWQASGPMVKSFKVFTHLVDSEDRLWSQHDAPPGGGCCPTQTWAEGEVIVDEHIIAVGADLAPGAYGLVVGMYDEETESRLPAYNSVGEKLDHDRVPVSTVAIVPTSASGEGWTAPAEPKFDFSNVTYLPLMHKQSQDEN